MKSTTIAAILAPAVASAQWWEGAPVCAQSCLSSAWANATSTATATSLYWPAQTEFCDSSKGSDVSSCLAAGCSATPTAVSSYSSLSSSLCSAYSSCTAAGSTGVHTITYSGGSVNWGYPGSGWGTGHAGGPGMGGGGGVGGGPGNWGTVTGAPSSLWSEWASAWSASTTWTGGVVTVTGCVGGNGSPWFVGPGCGWNDDGGFNGWIGWGSGWSTTGSPATTTVTLTSTDASGSVSTTTGVRTIQTAVSGSLTTTIAVKAASTSGSTSSPTASGNAAPALRMGAAGSEGGMVWGMMTVCLGAVVLVAGLL